MRPVINLIVLLMALGMGISTAEAQETENDIVNNYLNQAVAKHTHKLGWASVNFSVDRINRNNDYNSFTDIESDKLTNGTFNWIEQGFSFGADFGIVFKERFAWSLGGEYWLELGETLPENDTYLQLSTNTTVGANPQSELQVLGVNTGLQYYLINPPNTTQKQSGVTARIGGSVGFYSASWDLWPEYENLNLSTNTPIANNTTFKGTAPGFSFGFGLDYPIGLMDFGLAIDASYLHLNFGNVAWYNSSGEEIIATYSGTTDGRVDLSLSGVRGKIELKRYFNW
ncbi:MAG: hypothetical protein J7J98_09200 [candidate division Zixibacteria bacterium]|nr:hypothetical protein [candidate division Zixibacteria bacterium]